MNLQKQKAEKEAARQARVLDSEKYESAAKLFFMKGVEWATNDIKAFLTTTTGKTQQQIETSYNEWEAGFNLLKEKNSPLISILRDNLFSMKSPYFSEEDYFKFETIDWLYQNLHKLNRRHPLYNDTIDIIEVIIKSHSCHKLNKYERTNRITCYIIFSRSDIFNTLVKFLLKTVQIFFCTAFLFYVCRVIIHN